MRTVLKYILMVDIKQPQNNGLQGIPFAVQSFNRQGPDFLSQA